MSSSFLLPSLGKFSVQLRSWYRCDATPGNIATSNPKTLQSLALTLIRQIPTLQSASCSEYGARMMYNQEPQDPSFSVLHAYPHGPTDTFCQKRPIQNGSPLPKVGALLEELVERIPKLKPAEARFQSFANWRAFFRFCINICCW